MNQSPGSPYVQLLRSAPDTNNGTRMGGIAQALKMGLQGYLMGQDHADQQAASQALLDGLTGRNMPGPKSDGSAGYNGPPGGTAGAVAALGRLQGNPYAGPMAQGLLLRQGLGRFRP